MNEATTLFIVDAFVLVIFNRRFSKTKFLLQLPLLHFLHHITDDSHFC